MTLSGAVAPAQPEGTAVTIEWRPRGAGSWAAPEAPPATLAADSTYSVTLDAGSRPRTATSGTAGRRAGRRRRRVTSAGPAASQ